MANLGNLFRDKVVDYIKSWDAPLEVLQEVNVGYRFVKSARKLDIVIRNTLNNKFMAIECKSQFTNGTAYEKFSYALEDCIASPIPTILVFAGEHIKDDMKSKLIMSGHGIEMDFVEESEGNYVLSDYKNLMKQRCYIELGLNWFPFATGDKIGEQLEHLSITDCTEEVRDCIEQVKNIKDNLIITSKQIDDLTIKIGEITESKQSISDSKKFDTNTQILSQIELFHKKNNSTVFADSSLSVEECICALELDKFLLIKFFDLLKLNNGDYVSVSAIATLSPVTKSLSWESKVCALRFSDLKSKKNENRKFLEGAIIDKLNTHGHVVEGEVIPLEYPEQIIGRCDGVDTIAYIIGIKIDYSSYEC